MCTVGMCVHSGDVCSWYVGVGMHSGRGVHSEVCVHGVRMCTGCECVCTVCACAWWVWVCTVVCARWVSVCMVGVCVCTVGLGQLKAPK